MDINKSLHIEGMTAPHRWEEAKDWLTKFDHPLWQRYVADAEGAGHGGMDFFVVHAFLEAIRREEPTPISVFDAAAWSVITPLSEWSVANQSNSIAFPDFTRGLWKTGKQIFANSDLY